MLRKNLLYNSLLLVMQLVASMACKGQTKSISGNALKEYVIVQPDRPSAMERKAVNEFRTYFQKSTGILLPVVTSTKNKAFYIGGSNALNASMSYAGIADDGYFIRSKGDNIYISGKGKKGTLYGVYTFLEKILNISMLAPGVFDIPNQHNIVIPRDVNIVENPQFLHREIYNDIALDPEYADWHKLNHMVNNPEWGTLYHTAFILLPPDKYFKTHPEYYSLIAGKRTPQQLCYSNPNLPEVLTAILREKMKQKPTARNWFVAQEDNYNMCECEECNKLYKKYRVASGAQLQLVNNIAARFPDMTFFTFAYKATILAPERIVPAPNVVICFAALDAVQSSGFDKDAANKVLVQCFLGWKAITKNLFYWDYWINFGDMLMPFPNIYTFKENINFFRKQGVKYVYEEGINKKGGELKELKTYVLAKLLWNPSLSTDVLIKHFCDRYYGPASTQVIAYIQQITAVSKKEKAKLEPGGRQQYFETILKKEHLKNYDAVLSKAQAAVSNNAVYTGRVEALRASIDYYLLLDNSSKIMKAQSAADGERTQRMRRVTDRGDIDEISIQTGGNFKYNLPDKK